MITVNRMGDSISGSINAEQFGIPFNENIYNKMIELQKKADSVETVAELKEIVEEFKALTENVNYNDVIQSKCPDIYYNQAKGTYHLKVKDEVSSVPMPQALVDKILASLDKGLDFTPLIKLWVRWLRNPILKMKNTLDSRNDFSQRMFDYIDADYTNYELVEKLMNEDGVSQEVAIERATIKQVGITVEGLLKTYKVSKEVTTKYALDKDGNKVVVDRIETTKSIDPDTGLITYEKAEHTNEDRLFKPAVMDNSGDSFFCGDKEGHLIRVGQRHYLSDWSKVNTNDNESCVPGLHCGGLTYIRGYQHSGTETHNILVDPMHIGAVPFAGDGAIRVKEYFVLDAFSGVNGAIYHSSTYAKQTDAQWEEMKKAILVEYGKLKDSLDSHANEINDL